MKSLEFFQGTGIDEVGTAHLFAQIGIGFMWRSLCAYGENQDGGKGGIRTLGTVTRTHP